MEPKRRLACLCYGIAKGQGATQFYKGTIMDNRGLLIIIILLLLCGGGYMVYQHQHETPGQKIADGVGDAVKDVGNSVKNAAH